MEEEMRPPFGSIGQTVRVGFTLKRQLEEAARAQGADSTWLARKILREGLGVQDRSLWSGGDER